MGTEEFPKRYASPRQDDEATPLTSAWAQPQASPRPGHGSIYVMPGSHAPRWHGEELWEAKWVDEFVEPDDNGEMAGLTFFEGRRNEVLAWARSQPAAARLMPEQSSEDGSWVPLPDADDDVPY